jgi:Na+/glutamate symporter
MATVLLAVLASLRPAHCRAILLCPLLWLTATPLGVAYALAHLPPHADPPPFWLAVALALVITFIWSICIAFVFPREILDNYPDAVTFVATHTLGASAGPPAC